MVKTVKEAVQEVVEGKKQGLHITFQAYEREMAIEAMQRRGMDIREGFDGPIFEDIAGYTINGDWVAVMTKEGETYVYPAAGVARIKHFSI